MANMLERRNIAVEAYGNGVLNWWKIGSALWSQ